MRKLLSLIALAACVALAAVASASAGVRDLTPPTTDVIMGAKVNGTFAMRAAGTVRSWNTTGTKEYFNVNLHAGPGNKIELYDPARGLTFRALNLRTIAYLPHAAKLTGIGLVNGHRVHFTAIATDHPMGTDVFKISWAGHASHGGVLRAGNVRITEISV